MSELIRLMGSILLAIIIVVIPTLVPVCIYNDHDTLGKISLYLTIMEAFGLTMYIFSHC